MFDHVLLLEDQGRLQYDRPAIHGRVPRPCQNPVKLRPEQAKDPEAALPKGAHEHTE